VYGIREEWIKKSSDVGVRESIINCPPEPKIV